MIGAQTARRAIGLRWEGEELSGAAGGLLRHMRPADGWVALILLALNLCVVVLAVEQADWAPTPSLVGVLLLGMLTAFVFYRLPVFWFQAIIPGLVLGGLTVVWLISGSTFDGETPWRRRRSLGPPDPLGGRGEGAVHKHRQGALRLRPCDRGLADRLRGGLGVPAAPQFLGRFRSGRAGPVLQSDLPAAQYQLPPVDLPLHCAASRGARAGRSTAESLGPAGYPIRRGAAGAEPVRQFLFGSGRNSNCATATGSRTVVHRDRRLRGYETALPSAWRMTSTACSPGCPPAATSASGFGTT